MRNIKVQFSNDDGDVLSGKINLPIDQNPHNFVLFAHCFTCTKNLKAITNISRSLTSLGFGVLRFDFTGLGKSEGEFKDSNFSSNVNDLLAASRFLDKNYHAPSVLIGHSLGGAAVLAVASKMESVRAVATIGAPSHPNHVTHLFDGSIDEIKKNGFASVSIGGQDFTIKEQFLDDLKSITTKEIIDTNKAALLIMHSPQDTVVGIKNAEELYTASRHPKSFITLDGADHLLSRQSDSLYVGSVIGSWASRYINFPEETKIDTDHQVAARLSQEDNFTTDIQIRKHSITADEPIDLGGDNFGPTPYDLLSASLASCTAMTMQMYARRKKWDLKEVEVHISHAKEHMEDCEECASNTSKIDTFKRAIKISGELDYKQVNRLLEIADKCPVHRTLHSETQVLTKAID